MFSCKRLKKVINLPGVYEAFLGKSKMRSFGGKFF